MKSCLKYPAKFIRKHLCWSPFFQWSPEYRSCHPEVFLGKGVLKMWSNIAKQLYWNCTSVWVFSCKFAAYFQNTFFTEHLWVATSEDRDLPVTLLKRDSGTGVVFLILQKKKNSRKNSIVDVRLGSKYALASGRYW